MRRNAIRHGQLVGQGNQPIVLVPPKYGSNKGYAKFKYVAFYRGYVLPVQSRWTPLFAAIKRDMDELDPEGNYRRIFPMGRVPLVLCTDAKLIQQIVTGEIKTGVAGVTKSLKRSWDDPRIPGGGVMSATEGTYARVAAGQTQLHILESLAAIKGIYSSVLPSRAFDFVEHYDSHHFAVLSTEIFGGRISIDDTRMLGGYSAAVFNKVFLDAITLHTFSWIARTPARRKYSTIIGRAIQQVKAEIAHNKKIDEAIAQAQDSDTVEAMEAEKIKANDVLAALVQTMDKIETALLSYFDAVARLSPKEKHLAAEYREKLLKTYPQLSKLVSQLENWHSIKYVSMKAKVAAAVRKMTISNAFELLFAAMDTSKAALMRMIERLKNSNVWAKLKAELDPYINGKEINADILDADLPETIAMLTLLLKENYPAPIIARTLIADTLVDETELMLREGNTVVMSIGALVDYVFQNNIVFRTLRKLGQEHPGFGGLPGTISDTNNHRRCAGAYKALLVLMQHLIEMLRNFSGVEIHSVKSAYGNNNTVEQMILTFAA